jgi:hypothetical protein
VLIKTANNDFRDVLSVAEYPELFSGADEPEVSDEELRVIEAQDEQNYLDGAIIKRFEGMLASASESRAWRAWRAVASVASVASVRAWRAWRVGNTCPKY